MTVLSRTPENTNLLQPTKYLLTFDRLGTAQYFCQEVNIPSVSMPQTPMSSPLHSWPVAGLNIQYDELRISFIIDEEAMSWRNLYNWFLAISSPESFDERNHYQDLQNSSKTSNKNNFSVRSYSDATLTVLSNLNNPLLRIQFIGVFPVSLSGINFDTKLSADTILTADASFEYEYYKFLPLE